MPTTLPQNTQVLDFIRTGDMNSIRDYNNAKN